MQASDSPSLASDSEKAEVLCNASTTGMHELLKSEKEAQRGRAAPLFIRPRVPRSPSATAGLNKHLQNFPIKSTASARAAGGSKQGSRPRPPLPVSSARHNRSSLPLSMLVSRAHPAPHGPPGLRPELLKGTGRPFTLSAPRVLRCVSRSPPPRPPQMAGLSA